MNVVSDVSNSSFSMSGNERSVSTTVKGWQTGLSLLGLGVRVKEGWETDEFSVTEGRDHKEDKKERKREREREREREEEEEEEDDDDEDGNFNIRTGLGGSQKKGKKAKLKKKARRKEREEVKKKAYRATKKKEKAVRAGGGFYVDDECYVVEKGVVEEVVDGEVWR